MDKMEHTQSYYKSLPTAPPESFLKYDVPILEAKLGKEGKFVKMTPKKTKERHPFSFPSVIALTNCTHLNKMVDRDRSMNEVELRKLLEHLFPPVTWRKDKAVYTQNVSIEEACNEDMTVLAQTLADQIYLGREFPHYSACETYLSVISNVFDELNRQILIERPLAGILLRRIKDYMIEEIDNRRKLWISLCAYRGRKELQMSEQQHELRNQLAYYELTKPELVQEIETLEKQLETLKTDFKSQVQEIHKHFQDDMSLLLTEKHKQQTRLKQMAGILH